MNVIVTLLFSIFAINQAVYFPLTVHIARLQGNSELPVSVKLLTNSSDGDFDATNYQKFEITFNRDVDEENDIPLTFIYYTANGRAFNEEPGDLKHVNFCKTDHRTIEGSTASLVARVLGIKDDPPCPIKKGTSNIQDEIFTLNWHDYENLIYDLNTGEIDSYIGIFIGPSKLCEIRTTYLEDD